jgi:hypothetical protein
MADMLDARGTNAPNLTPAPAGGGTIPTMKEDQAMSGSTIATYHGNEPVADGDQVVIEQRNGETVARKVARLDSDEPIRSLDELADSMAEFSKRRGR